MRRKRILNAREMAKKMHAALTPEQRRESARRAANARWANHRKKKQVAV